MGSFIVWDMSSKVDGVWRNVEAADARAAAESICGRGLKTFGKDSDICVRVRSLDDRDQPAAVFYGEKSGQAAREMKMRQKLSDRPLRPAHFKVAAE